MALGSFISHKLGIKSMISQKKKVAQGCQPFKNPGTVCYYQANSDPFHMLTPHSLCRKNVQLKQSCAKIHGGCSHAWPPQQDINHWQHKEENSLNQLYLHGVIPWHHGCPNLVRSEKLSSWHKLAFLTPEPFEPHKIRESKNWNKDVYLRCCPVIMNP